MTSFVCARTAIECCITNSQTPHKSTVAVVETLKGSCALKLAEDVSFQQAIHLHAWSKQRRNRVPQERD